MAKDKDKFALLHRIWVPNGIPQNFVYLGLRMRSSNERIRECIGPLHRHPARTRQAHDHIHLSLAFLKTNDNFWLNTVKTNLWVN